MPTALDPLQRAVDLVDEKAIALLDWCAARFLRTYGWAGDPLYREDRWILPIGSVGNGSVQISLDYDPNDNDGGLAVLRFAAATDSGWLYGGASAWFPVVHTDRNWPAFAELVRDRMFLDAILALIRETQCRTCGWQEHGCHNEQTLGGGRPCCDRCDHPLSLRRPS